MSMTDDWDLDKIAAQRGRPAARPADQNLNAATRNRPPTAQLSELPPAIVIRTGNGSVHPQLEYFLVTCWRSPDISTVDGRPAVRNAALGKRLSVDERAERIYRRYFLSELAEAAQAAIDPLTHLKNLRTIAQRHGWNSASLQKSGGENGKDKTLDECIAAHCEEYSRLFVYFMQDENINAKMRLYLNVLAPKIETVLDTIADFMKAYGGAGVHSLKAAGAAIIEGRRDTIVVYVASKQDAIALGLYLNNVAKDCFRFSVPFMTYKFNRGMSFGAEPEKILISNPRKQAYSFGTIRAEAIAEAFERYFDLIKHGYDVNGLLDLKKLVCHQFTLRGLNPMRPED